MYKKEKSTKIISLNNINIVNGEYLIIKVNPKIYSLDIVQSAAYVLMDRAFAIVDGDPNKELLIELKPREKKEDLEKLGRDFNNELINYAVYKIQSKRTVPLREKIIQRALLTNLRPEISKEKEDEGFIDRETASNSVASVPEPDSIVESSNVDESEPDVDADYIDDPEGIAMSWQEGQASEKTEESMNCKEAESTCDADDSSICPVEPDSVIDSADVDKHSVDADYLDDPEGIAVPWQEGVGYKKTEESEISEGPNDGSVAKEESEAVNDSAVNEEGKVIKDSSEADYLDDPEGIAVPWNEKRLKEK